MLTPAHTASCACPLCLIPASCACLSPAHAHFLSGRGRAQRARSRPGQRVSAPDWLTDWPAWPAVNGAGGGKVESLVRRAFGAMCSDFHRAESGTEVSERRRARSVAGGGGQERGLGRGRTGPRVPPSAYRAPPHLCTSTPVHPPHLCTCPPVRLALPVHPKPAPVNVGNVLTYTEFA